MKQKKKVPPMTFGDKDNWFELQPGDGVTFKKDNNGNVYHGICDELKQSCAIIIVEIQEKQVRFMVRRKSMIRSIQSPENKKLKIYNHVKAAV